MFTIINLLVQIVCCCGAWNKLEPVFLENEVIFITGNAFEHLQVCQFLPIYSIDDSTIAIKVTPQDWIKSSYGVMEKAWKDIDPIAELERMRNEW